MSSFSYNTSDNFDLATIFLQFKNLSSLFSKLFGTLVHKHTFFFCNFVKGIDECRARLLLRACAVRVMRDDMGEVGLFALISALS